MASLADFFNPTFLMFLGILVLVVAVLVLYYESKIRDQNHKIASMLSLVSTLAEDMNGVKMGLNHLAIRTSYIVPSGGNLEINPIIQHNDNLIEVSDDEDEEDEDEEDDDSEEDDEEEYDEDEDEDDNESIHTEQSNDSNNNIKIFKLNISQDDSESEDNLDLDETTDLDGDFEPVDEVPHVTDEYVEEVLDLKYDEIKEDVQLIPSSSDLKTISINLGDEPNINETSIDYRKLQIPKLRSIVVEKNLASNSDATKLKKPELLKLLGVE
jgi:hypothetical protein